MSCVFPAGCWRSAATRRWWTSSMQRCARRAPKPTCSDWDCAGARPPGRVPGLPGWRGRDRRRPEPAFPARRGGGKAGADRSADAHWPIACWRPRPNAAPQPKPGLPHFATALAAVGGVTLEPPRPAAAAGAARNAPTDHRRQPARDPAYHLCRFYWPDIVDPTFPYGEGLRLQLRTAVSHLNEVWAVETAGAILFAFAGRTRLGVRLRRSALDLRREPPLPHGHRAAGQLGLSRRTNCRWVPTSTTARPGSRRSTGWACCTSLRPRISARRMSGLGPLPNLATTSAGMTWSSTGLTRRSMPTTATTGWGPCTTRGPRKPRRPMCYGRAAANWSRRR